MDGVHVRDKVSGLGLLGQSASKKLIVIQIVDDEEETLETSVGLGEELVVILQFDERNISELGEELLSGRVQLEMPRVTNICYLELLSNWKYGQREEYILT